MTDRFGYGEIGLNINTRHPCEGCRDYDAPDGCKSNGGCGKPTTNADRIRAMTDEELAVWLDHHVSCSRCPLYGKCISYKTCSKNLQAWLKEEVSE